MIKYTIVCPNCGKTKTFEKKCIGDYEKKFCCKSCASSHTSTKRSTQQSKMMKKLWKDPEYRAKQIKKQPYTIFCLNCNTERIFEGYPHRPKRKFCNRSCAISYNNRRAWADPKIKEKRVARIIESHNTQEYHQKAILGWTDERRKKQAELSRVRLQNNWDNPEWAKRQREIFQTKWQDPEYQRAWVRGIRLRPTRPELELFELLNTIGYPYIYIGDGGLWVGTKNPDFIWPGQRRLIEMFGNYWHNDAEIKPRKEYFANYGFETLFVWDYELNNKKELLTKLKDFHNI